MSEVHAILNLERYAAYVRKRVAAAMAEDYTDNLDEFLTIGQACDMVLDCSIGRDEEGRPLLDDAGHSRLFETVKTRIFNCGLSKLAANGTLDCAWDDKRKNMIFWNSYKKE